MNCVTKQYVPLAFAGVRLVQKYCWATALLTSTLSLSLEHHSPPPLCRRYKSRIRTWDSNSKSFLQQNNIPSNWHNKLFVLFFFHCNSVSLFIFYLQKKINDSTAWLIQFVYCTIVLVWLNVRFRFPLRWVAPQL